MYIIIDTKKKKGYMVTDATGVAKIVGRKPDAVRYWFAHTTYKEHNEFYITNTAVRVKSKRHTSKETKKYFKKGKK